MGYKPERDHAVETSRDCREWIRSSLTPPQAPTLGMWVEVTLTRAVRVRLAGESCQPQSAGTGEKRKFRHKGKPVWELSQWALSSLPSREAWVPEAPWDLRMLTPVLRAPGDMASVLKSHVSTARCALLGKPVVRQLALKLHCSRRDQGLSTP